MNVILKNGQRGAINPELQEDGRYLIYCGCSKYRAESQAWHDHYRDSHPEYCPKGHKEPPVKLFTLEQALAEIPIILQESANWTSDHP